ncbi:MAG: hypothetical protein CMR00_02410 [[Chlorobium] sp. 445]|nr:MAG: hypothetical protein CMR00_02410 [[Chlorobium] sp. 445]
MTTVEKNPLLHIIKLQLLDDELDAILSEQKGLPEEISALEAQIAELSRQLEQRAKRLEENQAKRIALRTEIKDAQEKIKKYKDAQTKARNNKEYDALSKQIEFEEQEIKRAESQIRAIEALEEQFEQLEQKGKELLAENRYDELTPDMYPTDELKKHLAEAEAEHKRKQKELNTIIKNTQAEVDELRKKIKKQREVVQAHLKHVLVKYDQLRRGNVQNVVVKFSRNACSGCNTRVPASRHAFIFQGGFYSCETCGRIVVHERLFEELAGVTSE